jgi:putative transposase
MKSKKIKLYNLTYLDQLKLNTLSNEHRLLYNYLLNYIKANNTCDFKKINEEYKNYRKNNNLTINSKSAQNTSRNLINNIKSFFSLRKKDNTAKFPKKFKSWKYFTSFTYDFNNGCGGFKIKDNQLIINKLLTINLPVFCNDINNENIKTISFKKEDNNYYCIFVYSEKATNDIKKINNNFISIDIGVSNIVTATSNKIDSFQIKNTNFKKLEKNVETIQSKRDLRNKNSLKYKKLNNIHKKKKRKLTNKKSDFQHKLSRKIIDICKENDTSKIIIGKLNTKKCKKNFKCKLNKSTQNSGLSRFMTFLEYKAKNDNIDYIKVNEAYTSQINCLTGKKEFNSDLSNRTVNLTNILTIDRDLNAAINIANKHLGKWLPHFETLKFHKMFLKEHSRLTNLNGEMNIFYNTL